MGNLYHHQHGKSLIPFIFIQLGLVKPHDWTIQNCSGVFCFRFEWPHVLWHIYIYMYKWYVYPIIIFLLCAHILSGFYINLYINISHYDIPHMISPNMFGFNRFNRRATKLAGPVVHLPWRVRDHHQRAALLSRVFRFGVVGCRSHRVGPNKNQGDLDDKCPFAMEKDVGTWMEHEEF